MRQLSFIVLTFLSLLGINGFAGEKTLYFNASRGFAPFKHATEQGIVIDNQSDTLQWDYLPLSSKCEEFTADFRARNENANPMKKYPYYDEFGVKNMVKNPKWGFFLTLDSDTIVVTVSGKEENTLPEPTPTAKIQVFGSQGIEIESKTLVEGLNPYDKDNIWKIDFRNNTLSIEGGNNGLIPLFNLVTDSEFITGFGFLASWGSKLVVSDIALTTQYEDLDHSMSIPLEELEAYLEKSDDLLEGYWTMFDRDLEESLLKLGGQYSLACVKEGDDYLFLYLDGASVNKGDWQPGDIKIILYPTPFPGIYDVEWFDSEKKTLSHEIKAQRGEGDTLTIQFPYQNSKLRLRKLPSPGSSTASGVTSSETTPKSSTTEASTGS